MVLKQFRFSLMAATILAAGSAGFGVTASAQTLTEVLVATYQNNPTLQSERSTLAAGDEAVPQALGRWRPNVDLVGDYGVRRNRGNQLNADSTRDFYSGGLQVTQNLYEGGETEARVKLAEADIKADRARLLETEQDILFDATTAYVNVLRDKAVLDLNGQNEERLSRQLEATRDRFEVGEVTRTDVAQAESRLSGARASRIAAEGDLEVSNAFFEQVVGVAPGSLTVPDNLPELPESREAAVDMALSNNPSVLASQFDLESAEHTVRVQASDLLPSVDLIGTATRDRNVSAEDVTLKALALTATVTVPIYQQGIETSEIREARQLAVTSQRDIDNARRLAIEDVTSAWEVYISRIAQIEAQNDEVRASQIALEGVEQEAAVGSRTVLDVLDAEQELLDARVNLVEARRDQIVAHYALIASVGSMTAAGLELPVEIFDPTDNYSNVRNKIYDAETWNELYPGIIGGDK